MSISLIVHTRNSERTLPKVLSCIGFVDEFIAIDMSSDDQTRQLLQDAGARVETIDPDTWRDSLRNPWLQTVSNPWTLVLDSDEYLAEDAGEIIEGLVKAAPKRVSAYALPRYNYCFGKVLTGPRWYPDHQIRLFRSGSIEYADTHHTPPQIVGKGIVVSLSPEAAPHIHHQHYPTLASMIERQLHYALTDRYTSNFDYSEFTEKALEAMNRQRMLSDDDERAAEVVMAWDKMVRAVISWERAGKPGPLPESFGLLSTPLVGRRVQSNSKGFGVLRRTVRHLVRQLRSSLQSTTRRRSG